MVETDLTFLRVILNIIEGSPYIYMEFLKMYENEMTADEKASSTSQQRLIFLLTLLNDTDGEIKPLCNQSINQSIHTYIHTLCRYLQTRAQNSSTTVLESTYGSLNLKSKYFLLLP